LLPTAVARQVKTSSSDDRSSSVAGHFSVGLATSSIQRAPGRRPQPSVIGLFGSVAAILPAATTQSGRWDRCPTEGPVAQPALQFPPMAPMQPHVAADHADVHLGQATRKPFREATHCGSSEPAQPAWGHGRRIADHEQDVDGRWAANWERDLGLSPSCGPGQSGARTRRRKKPRETGRAAMQVCQRLPGRSCEVRRTMRTLYSAHSKTRPRRSPASLLEVRCPPT